MNAVLTQTTVQQKQYVWILMAATPVSVLMVSLEMECFALVGTCNL